MTRLRCWFDALWQSIADYLESLGDIDDDHLN